MSLPCGWEHPNNDDVWCELPALYRVHDVDDQGLASTYSCEDHVAWAMGWVRAQTRGGLAAVTKLPQPPIGSAVP